MNKWNVIQGDALAVLASLPDESVDCCVTSPPYWGLRDYGHSGQMGLEETPEDYVKAMVDLFREVRRVLKPQGTLWLNLGDSYNNFRSQMGPGQAVRGREKLNGKPAEKSKRRGWDGLKEKDLIGIPWRVAFALQSDGWWLRQDIIWHKPNPMPESVTDRCTKAHEYVFLLSESERYHFNHEAIREDAVGKTHHDRTGGRYAAPGQVAHTGSRLRETLQSDGKRNKRDVWTIPTKPFKGAHFAVMPEALVEPCILAGCPAGGLVLDPFTGSGTVGAVALRLGRRFVGAELNPIYAEMARERIRQADPEGWDHLPLLTQPEPMEAQP